MSEQIYVMNDADHRPDCRAYFNRKEAMTIPWRICDRPLGHPGGHEGTPEPLGPHGALLAAALNYLLQLESVLSGEEMSRSGAQMDAERALRQAIDSHPFFDRKTQDINLQGPGVDTADQGAAQKPRGEPNPSGTVTA